MNRVAEIRGQKRKASEEPHSGPDSEPEPTSECAHRESHFQSQPSREAPIANIVAIKRYLCYRCLKPEIGGPLKRCRNCRRVAYCSVACQQLDWDLWHQYACGILQDINRSENRETARSRTWEEYYNYLMRYIRAIGRHKEEQKLRHFILFQPYCSTCHRTYENVIDKMSLFACTQCHIVFKCAQCTSATHPEDECARYQQFVENEVFMNQCYDLRTAIHCKMVTELPPSVYQPLSSAQNWLQFYTDISTFPYLRDQISEDFNFCTPKVPAELETLEYYRKAFRNSTYVNTTPVTVLAALERCLPDLSQRQTLHLHMINIGVNPLQLTHLNVFETQLFHLLPSLQHLELTIVSPITFIKPPSPGPATCCEMCKTVGRRRTIESHKGCYVDYVKLPHYKKPDLAIMLDGSIARDTKTTELLVDSGTLTLGTALCHEQMLDDIAALDTLHANFVASPEENKWKCLIVDYGSTQGEEHPFMYRNHFRYVFQGKKDSLKAEESLKDMGVVVKDCGVKREGEVKMEVEVEDSGVKSEGEVKTGAETEIEIGMEKNIETEKTELEMEKTEMEAEKAEKTEMETEKTELEMEKAEMEAEKTETETEETEKMDMDTETE